MELYGRTKRAQAELHVEMGLISEAYAILKDIVEYTNNSSLELHEQSISRLDSFSQKHNSLIALNDT
jgi:hypothetical protein